MAVIVGAIGAVIGSGGAANSAEDYTYQAQVSEQTESGSFSAGSREPGVSGD